MKGKATVKGTGKTPSTRTQGNRGNKTQDNVGYAPAVPISVYRDLAKELEKAQQQLSTIHAQNIHLKQQNQALRQEVIRVIQSAATLKDILQAPQSMSTAPPAKVNPSIPSTSSAASPPQSPSTSPQSPSRANPVADELIAELDRSLAADLSTSFQVNANPPTSVKSTEGIVGGPFCEVGNPDLDDEKASELSPDVFFTEQPTTPPNAIALEDEEKSRFLGGIWLPLTLVVVIITAFSAGFLIVLPFIEADKNN